MQHIYSVSYMCHNAFTGIIKHGSMIKTAHSKYEAEGMVTNELQTAFPASAGWGNHDSVALELTVEQIVILLAHVTKPEK